MVNLASNENYVTFSWFEEKSGVILVILLSTLYFSTSVLSNDQNIFIYSQFGFDLFLTLLLVTFGWGGGFPFFATKPHFRKGSFNLLNSFSTETPFLFSNRMECLFLHLE